MPAMLGASRLTKVLGKGVGERVFQVINGFASGVPMAVCRMSALAWGYHIPRASQRCATGGSSFAS